MQTNIQQFVKDNQGSLITFLHNSKRVSKVVVDIQGEYFTGKSQVSDAKIDGFYYFSDCRMLYDHPLVEILEKHNVSVLNLSIGRSCIFKYNHYDDYDSMVNGTCLTTSQPVGFHIDSIKEAWAIVMIDSKYTKVYPQTPSTTPSPMDKLASYFEAQNNVKNAFEKVNNALENNKEVAIYTIDGCTYEKFNFNSIVNDVVVGIYKGKTVNIPIKNIGNINSNVGSLLYVKDFKELSFKEPNTKGPMDKLASYFEAQNNVKNACEKVNNTLEKLNNSFDKVFKSIDSNKPSQEPTDIDKEQYSLIKKNAKMFLKISYDLGGYAPYTINEFLNKLLFIKEREFSLEVLQEFRDIFEELKDELILQMKKNFKTDPEFQALMKLFVEFSLLILTENSPNKDNVKKLLENVNKVMTEDGRKEYNEWFKIISQKNIKYRGKPKTVEIVNEYTHINGKEYVLVKDVTDNGKTKTLFKEYIEWL